MKWNFWRLLRPFSLTGAAVGCRAGHADIRTAIGHTFRAADVTDSLLNQRRQNLDRPRPCRRLMLTQPPTQFYDRRRDSRLAELWCDFPHQPKFRVKPLLLPASLSRPNEFASAK